MKREKKTRKEKSSKYSLLKVIGIAFLVFACLSWIIPSGYFSNSKYIEYGGGTTPVGLLGLFINPLYSFGIFAQYFLLFLAIGGFYGVLNATGVYGKLINKISNCFKTRKALCLILTVIIFSILASLIGNPTIIFILVPFGIAVTLNVGYSKVTALAATVGSTLVGIMGSIFGTDPIFISSLSVKVFNGIWTKVIFFTVITLLYTLFMLYQSGIIRIRKKKNTDKKEVIGDKELEVTVYENNDNSKRSIVPLLIILFLSFLLIFVGVINWEYVFGIEIFNNFYTTVTEIEWLNKLFGYIPIIGYFGNYDVTAILLVVTFLIKWIYSINFDTFVESFTEGVKKMIKPAVYVIFASVIFAVMVNGNYNISTTISSWILKINENFFVLIITLLGYVGAFFFNDFPYLINSMYGALAAFDSNNYTIMCIILQASYGLAMLSLPVSVVLIGGLKYLNISYKEWMKYIYKFLLAALVIIVIFSLIVLAI